MLERLLALDFGLSWLIETLYNIVFLFHVSFTSKSINLQQLNNWRHPSQLTSFGYVWFHLALSLFNKAFWILGLLNNFLYVTMNAGAEDINEVAGCWRLGGAVKCRSDIDGTPMELKALHFETPV